VLHVLGCVSTGKLQTEALPECGSSSLREFLLFTAIIFSITVKPRCIIFEGDGKQKQSTHESDSCGKPLRTIDKKF
jgi:hypothetical protein